MSKKQDYEFRGQGVIDESVPRSNLASSAVGKCAESAESANELDDELELEEELELASWPPLAFALAFLLGFGAAGCLGVEEFGALVFGCALALRFGLSKLSSTSA